jgi:hypothetical protein
MCSLALFFVYMFTTSGKVIYTVLSALLREVAEFRHYPLVAISVFYKCMFWYKSAGHKCDNSLLFWACCLHSDNLYVPWFVFITECEFDNTDMEGTLYIEWRHVSGVRTHRSVKCCINPLSHQFWSYSSRSTACISIYISLQLSAGISRFSFVMVI